MSEPAIGAIIQTNVSTTATAKDIVTENTARSIISGSIQNVGSANVELAITIRNRGVQKMTLEPTEALRFHNFPVESIDAAGANGTITLDIILWTPTDYEAAIRESDIWIDSREVRITSSITLNVAAPSPLSVSISSSVTLSVAIASSVQLSVAIASSVQLSVAIASSVQLNVNIAASAVTLNIVITAQTLDLTILAPTGKMVSTGATVATSSGTNTVDYTPNVEKTLLSVSGRGRLSSIGFFADGDSATDDVSLVLLRVYIDGSLVFNLSLGVIDLLFNGNQLLRQATAMSTAYYAKTVNPLGSITYAKTSSDSIGQWQECGGFLNVPFEYTTSFSIRVLHQFESGSVMATAIYGSYV